MELQHQQASLGSLQPTVNSRSSLLQPYALGAAKPPDETPASSTGIPEVDPELQLLLEIASGAFVTNNKIDLSLLSLKQRQAIVRLRRF